VKAWFNALIEWLMMLGLLKAENVPHYRVAG